MAKKQKNPWMKNPFEEILRAIPLPLPDPRDVLEGQMPDGEIGPNYTGEPRYREFIAPSNDPNILRPDQMQGPVPFRKAEDGGMGLAPANAIVPFLQAAQRLAQRGAPGALKLLERYGKGPFEGLIAQDPSTFVPGEPQQPPAEAPRDQLSRGYKIRDVSDEGFDFFQEPGDPRAKFFEVEQPNGKQTSIKFTFGSSKDEVNPNSDHYKFRRFNPDDKEADTIDVQFAGHRDRRTYDNISEIRDPQLWKELGALVRNKYPNMKYIRAERITGARRGSMGNRYVTRDLEELYPAAEIVPNDTMRDLRELRALRTENKQLKQSQAEERFKALDTGQVPKPGSLRDAPLGVEEDPTPWHSQEPPPGVRLPREGDAPDALTMQLQDRMNKAEQYITQRSQPLREVTPDNQVELQLQQRLQQKNLKFNPPRKVIDTVMESFTDGSVSGMLNTNPSSGRTSLLFPPMGGGRLYEIPFENRLQALAFIDYLAGGNQAPDEEFLKSMSDRMHRELGINYGEAMD